MGLPAPSDEIGGGFQLSLQFDTYVVMLDASSAAVKVPLETGRLFPCTQFCVAEVTYGVNDATVEFFKLNGCSVEKVFKLITTMTVFPFPV